jgi:hypothetical protein
VHYYSTSALFVLMSEAYSVHCKIEVTQDIHVSYIRGKRWTEQEEEDSFTCNLNLNLRKNCQMQQIKHGFVWCWHFGTPESRLEIPETFWSVVLEKAEKDQQDISCDRVLRRGREGTNLVKRNKGRINWVVVTCVGTAFCNMLLQDREK